MANPIVEPSGGGASEVPALIAYAAKQLHTTPAAAAAAIKKNFPHTFALLNAIPLSAVTAEIPKLVAFLATTLKLTPAQVLAALKANFPALYEAITNLPTVTNGWYHIPALGDHTQAKWPKPTPGAFNYYHESTQHLLDCILDDRDPIPNVEWGLHITEMMCGAIDASRSGNRYELTTALPHDW